MFDNPDQELKRLEDQLLKAEMTDEEFERFYDDLYDEFGPEEDHEDLLKDSPVNNVRNYANGYGAKPRPAQARPSQPRQSQPQNRPVGKQTQQRPAQQGRFQQSAPGGSRYMTPTRKDNSIRVLTITACAECAGIVGVVLWWLIRFL